MLTQTPVQFSSHDVHTSCAKWHLIEAMAEKIRDLSASMDGVTADHLKPHFSEAQIAAFSEDAVRLARLRSMREIHLVRPGDDLPDDAAAPGVPVPANRCMREMA